MAAAHHAVKPAALTPEEQMQAIIHTFSVIEKTELSNLKHPTKPHLQAVESYDILPDEELWANQYALFKFADNPNDRKSGQSVRTSFLKLSCTYTKTDVAFSDWFVLAQSQPVASSSSAAASIGLIRPLENDEESGSNRVAYFVPDDDEAANAYNTRRHAGANADQQLLDGEDVQPEEEETDEYGFKFVRDYDAIRRETNKEYIFVIEDGEEGEGQSATKQEEEEEDKKDGKSISSSQRRRPKGAYYVPLVSHTLLRKRRARKGEVRNDYDDLGIEFWGGMLVQLGGKEVFPQDEAEARKLEMESIRNPPTVSDDAAGVSEQQQQTQQQEQTQETKPEIPVNGNHVMQS
jgi:RNA polymerase II-associated factor 1